MKLLLMSSPVPDTSEYHIPGFVRSGNLALLGIAEGLYRQDKDILCYGFQPIQAFPKFKQVWVSSQRVRFGSGLVVNLVGSPNLFLVRECWRNIASFFLILKWAWQNRGQKRCIVMYNIYVPNFAFIFCACRLTKSFIIPILFDIGGFISGTSPKGIRGWEAHVRERFLNQLVSKAHGRSVITEAICDKFCKGKHAILIDGGVSSEIIHRLFPLERTSHIKSGRVNDNKSENLTLTGKTIFVLAGAIESYNGIDLLLDAVQLSERRDFEIWFLGEGSRSNRVREMALNDRRILYKGMLNLDQLFEIYREADVLLNLRLTKEMDTSTFFPSKLLEYLCVGRFVVSTAVAHAKRDYGTICRILEEETPRAVMCCLEDVINMGRETRDDMGRRARSTMLEQHTWEIQMARFYKYCEGVVYGRYENVKGLVSL